MNQQTSGQRVAGFEPYSGKSGLYCDGTPESSDRPSLRDLGMRLIEEPRGQRPAPFKPYDGEQGLQSEWRREESGGNSL
jgi:hypothetical protein